MRTHMNRYMHNSLKCLLVTSVCFVTVACGSVYEPRSIIPGNSASALMSTVDVSRLRETAATGSVVSNAADSDGGLKLAAATRVSDAAASAGFGGEMNGRSAAIFYGARPPVAELAQFDRIILEPDNVTSRELKGMTKGGASAYAYLSVGEVGPHRAFAKNIEAGWILGENKIWNSKVLDMSNPGWAGFLLKRIDKLVADGYEGLFLDTMDSYQIYSRTASKRRIQEEAMVSFLASVKSRHPQLKMIANRGFEVLEKGARYLEAVAAESLYASWDNTRQKYVDVPAADREWLMLKLNEAKTNYGLDVIAIEYAPPSERERALEVARKVASHGFVPWVSTPAFDYVGVGLLEVKPRKVIMLFDSDVHGYMKNSTIHNIVAAPIEYLGLVPVYIDLAKDPLPQEQLRGIYAGIVSWSDRRLDKPGLVDWYIKQLQSGVPVVVMGTPLYPANVEIDRLMGMKPGSGIDLASAKITRRDALIGFDQDIPPRPELFGGIAQSISDSNTVHLRHTDKKDQFVDTVVTGPWGGLVLDPAGLYTDVDKLPYWTIDPFAFFSNALSVDGLPMPDVTTENGKRLWLSHIDGDALPSWAEFPGRKLGAEIIQERLLEKYPYPHTISVVEGEMVGLEKYADQRERMFSVAKSIFAMPNVEIATHTYSHPYNWRAVPDEEQAGKYNLPVPNYKYDPVRETAGSAKFIDDNLAPPGKKTKVMLWSGDALPLPDALQAATDAGLINLNGGNTIISKDRPSYALITPMARPIEGHVQVYAPIMNENVFTNDWSGPFDGFRRVIDTMTMTDHPRRIKPISIYYHFYAGTKVATMRAMEEIYSWSTEQDIFPVYASEYSVRVPDYREAGVARYLDGRWKLSNLGNVRSIRILNPDVTSGRKVASARWPDLLGSDHIAGARELHDGIYIHTDGASSATFKLGDKPPRMPYLVSSNGRVERWNTAGTTASFRVISHRPVSLELSAASGLCSISSPAGVVRGSKTPDGTIVFNFKNKDTGDAVLNCQA